MRTLNFTSERNYFHTLKEHNLTFENQIKKGFATITGFTKSELEVGDILNIRKTNYEIVDVVERRNHAGIFDNQEDKKNTFFKVKAKFEQIIEPKK